MILDTIDEAYFLHYGVLRFCNWAWIGGSTNQTDFNLVFNFSRDYIPDDSGMNEAKTSFLMILTLTLS